MIRKEAKNMKKVDLIGYSFMLLFLYAATNKLLDFQKFKMELGQSPLLTDYATAIAWLVPSVEILLSVLLYFKRTQLIGLYASFSLMLMFTIYIIIILNFAERIPCSCGGILDQMGWTEHLIFNLSFVLLAVAGIFLHGKFNQDILLRNLNREKLKTRNQE
ncbi:MauE/DoxX family redox-associated membrane protein [Pedobacter nyackensis]|uniref:MauE/DoxX family redox-associated membrane protein n=1 Tax=Pedobacter nyackensis TaxID=475255 RepID=UPI002930DA04|nr:MauE/DoxX family redox-associated membrane protein [Pedobacter nyackensis]